MEKLNTTDRREYESPDFRTVTLVTDTVLNASKYNGGTIDEYNFLGIYT